MSQTPRRTINSRHTDNEMNNVEVCKFVLKIKKAMFILVDVRTESGVQGYILT